MPVDRNVDQPIVLDSWLESEGTVLFPYNEEFDAFGVDMRSTEHQIPGERQAIRVMNWAGRLVFTRMANSRNFLAQNVTEVTCCFLARDGKAWGRALTRNGRRSKSVPPARVHTRARAQKLPQQAGNVRLLYGASQQTVPTLEEQETG